MKILNDKKIIALITVVLVFTIVYFVAVFKISYAFENDYDVNSSYNSIIDTIKKSATAYGEQNKDLFNENNTIYIKVQDLIDKGFLVPNEEGHIQNPLKESEFMNSHIVKIKYENEVVTVEVDG